MLLAQAVGGSGPAAGAKRPVLRIAQVPDWLRSDLKDRSDPTGQAAIPPWRFTQAAELLTGRFARVDDGGANSPDYPDLLQRRADILRPAKRFGYNPELLASSRIRSLVELDGARDRWRGLRSPPWVKQRVNDLVALRKLDFVSSAAEQDRKAELMALYLREPSYFDRGESSMRVWRTDDTADQATMVQIAKPEIQDASKKYREACNKTDAAELRLSALSSLLRDQIKSGRVDWGALIREAPGLRSALRFAEKNIMNRPLNWSQEP